MTEVAADLEVTALTEHDLAFERVADAALARRHSCYKIPWRAQRNGRPGT
jgi:hypothetical protein